MSLHRTWHMVMSSTCFYFFIFEGAGTAADVAGRDDGRLRGGAGRGGGGPSAGPAPGRGGAPPRRRRRRRRRRPRPPVGGAGRRRPAPRAAAPRRERPPPVARLRPATAIVKNKTKEERRLQQHCDIHCVPEPTTATTTKKIQFPTPPGRRVVQRSVTRLISSNKTKLGKRNDKTQYSSARPKSSRSKSTPRL